MCPLCSNIWYISTIITQIYSSCNMHYNILCIGSMDDGEMLQPSFRMIVTCLINTWSVRFVQTSTDVFKIWVCATIVVIWERERAGERDGESERAAAVRWCSPNTSWPTPPAFWSTPFCHTIQKLPHLQSHRCIRILVSPASFSRATSHLGADGVWLPRARRTGLACPCPGWPGGSLPR